MNLSAGCSPAYPRAETFLAWRRMERAAIFSPRQKERVAAVSGAGGSDAKSFGGCQAGVYIFPNLFLFL